MQTQPSPALSKNSRLLGRKGTCRRLLTYTLELAAKKTRNIGLVNHQTTTPEI